MMTTTNKALIGAVAAVAVLAGGWFFAKHQATSIAKDRVDGFLIRSNLRDKVTYDDLSASPFGSATLSGVKFKLSPATAVSVASLAVSGDENKHDQIHGIELVADGVDVPVLAIAREEHSRDASTAALIGMGYTNLTGKVTVSAHYDDQKQTFSFDTTGDVKDAGSWKLKLGLGGVDPRGLAVLASLNAAAAQSNAMALIGMAGQGLQYFGSLSLSVAEVSIDNSGLTKREAAITDQPLPPEEGQAVKKNFDETDLVRAGMAPSEASAARQAVDNWVAKGGTLKLASNLSQPLPLFVGGNLFQPVFNSVPGFLVATKSRISN